ncbi:MAG: hypothetical protein FJX77_13720, partial [Armatimonadetes bacterium]|nr:hypothetical protein [Armatimonadota bacterium]
MPCRSPLSVLLFSFSLAAADKLPPAAQIRVDFDRDVRPIFAASCYGCHGRTQQQSGLRLDRKIDALRGGDYGLVIVAGNSAQSKLILRLAGATPGVQMPPTGTLPPEQISILRAWIDQGAHFPDAPLAEAPPAPPLDPVVRDLFAAIRRDDLGAVRLLLARDPKLADARDGSGFTPLMFSAAYSSPGLVTLLLDHGASVNAASEPSGSRALAWAAGDPAKLRLLLSRGAQVNARSAQGRTPLLIAASQPGSAEAVRLLLDQGADPAIRDHSGNSPLAAAAATGDLEVMRLLLARGADVNAKTENGSTPLMAAARSR